MQRAFGTPVAAYRARPSRFSALTSINATMIVGARTNYAMARDWPALRFMGGWHRERGTPVPRILVQGAIALALVGFGALQHDGFEAMVEFTAPVFWSFLFLVGCAVRAARRDGAAERPFRVPLYPLTPIVFLRRLRVARVVEHRVCSEPRCGSRVAARDGGRLVRVAADASARAGPPLMVSEV
jgi:hypothetical protein